MLQHWGSTPTLGHTRLATCCFWDTRVPLAWVYAQLKVGLAAHEIGQQDSPLLQFISYPRRFGLWASTSSPACLGHHGQTPHGGLGIAQPPAAWPSLLSTVLCSLDLRRNTKEGMGLRLNQGLLCAEFRGKWEVKLHSRSPTLCRVITHWALAARLLQVSMCCKGSPADALARPCG